MIDFVTACAVVFAALCLFSWQRKRRHDRSLLQEARQHPRLSALALLAAFILFPVDMQDIWAVYLASPVARWGATAGSYAVFALLVTGVVLQLRSLFSCERNRPRVWKASERSVFWLSWSACGLFLAGYWLMFGYTESVDFSVTQCRQIASGNYNLMHPVVHTLLCQGLLKLWSDHAVVALFQVACFSFACAVYVAFCRWSELPRWWALLSAGALLVGMADLALFLGKDAPYVSGLMLLTTGLSWVILSVGKRGLWPTGAGLFLVATMRYDGLPVALLAGGGVLLAAVSLCGKAERRASIACCGITAALVLFCTAALPRLVDAKATDVGTKYAKPAFVLACLRAEQPGMSDALKSEIDADILPWETNRRQHRLLYLYRNGEVYIWPFLFIRPEDKAYAFHRSLTDDRRSAYVRLFFSAAMEYPWETAKILLFNAQMAWNCRPMFVFSCAFWLLLAAAAGWFLLKAARRPVLLLPALPVFGAIAAIAVAATTWELRYCYGSLAASPVFLAYAYACFRQKVCLASGAAQESDTAGRRAHSPTEAGSISSVNPS